LQKPLEPTAKIEEIAEWQLPAGEEVGGEDLIARVGGFHKILFALEFQNLHRFRLGVNQPDFGDSRLGIDGEFGGAIIRCGGRRQNLDDQIWRPCNPILLNDFGARIRDKIKSGCNAVSPLRRTSNGAVQTSPKRFLIT